MVVASPSTALLEDERGRRKLRPGRRDALQEESIRETVIMGNRKKL